MRLRLDRILFAFLAVLFAVHATAIALSWYFIYPWIDIPLHVAGGFWLGLLFFYLFLERQRVLSADMGFIPLAFFALGFVAFIGAGWEIYQYLLQVFVQNAIPFGGSIPGLHFDILKDIFDDLLGGLLAVALYYRFKLRGVKSS